MIKCTYNGKTLYLNSLLIIAITERTETSWDVVPVIKDSRQSTIVKGSWIAYQGHEDSNTFAVDQTQEEVMALLPEGRAL